VFYCYPRSYKRYRRPKPSYYNNGDEIPYPSDEDFRSYDEGQYGVYDNDPANADIYGNLYNWAVVNDEGGVCPEGWHVPSDEEWTDLITYLDVDTDPDTTGWQSLIAGGMLKDTGTMQDGDGLWNYYLDAITEEVTNESGFTGLPAGFRSYNQDGIYINMGNSGYFWSSSVLNSYSAWYRVLSHTNSAVTRFYYNKKYGISIRCLGD